jgi:hypothetical protein
MNTENSVICPKCGETITQHELFENDDICPCCSTDLAEALNLPKSHQRVLDALC